MNWMRIGFGLSCILNLALIVRLVTIDLHKVYRIFSAFLLFELIFSSLVLFERFSHLGYYLDYRVVWLTSRLTSWTLTIWMIYALLQAIFRKFPGILKISQRVLNVILPLAVGAALISAAPEYVASGAGNATGALNRLVSVAIVCERVIATVALLVLLLMLIFILWFPVRMPRNLAIFSIGFIVYFSAKTFLLLFRNFYSHESLATVGNAVTFILCICLAYWITFLNKEGELAPVTLGHSWRASRQPELMNDLEGLNTALARVGRR